MDYELFTRLHRLAREIANTAFWTASVTKGDIEAVYDNPLTGVQSSPIHISNHEEWLQWRAKVEGPSHPERIKELEQQLAQARALLAEIADGFTPQGGQCCFCEASYDYPSSDESVMEHADDCPILKLRAFLAPHKE